MTNPRVPTDYIIAHQKDRARIPADLTWQQAAIDHFKEMVEKYWEMSQTSEITPAKATLPEWLLRNIPAEDRQDLELWCQQHNVTIVPVNENEEYR